MSETKAAEKLEDHAGRKTEDDIAAERAIWLDQLELEDKHRLLFELESLEKGLDRFFNLTNLPLANMEQVVTINFLEELEIVLQFVDRIVDISERLLQASRREDYQFQYYVETKLLGDYERTRWREAVLSQRTPGDSLFVLYSTFVNFREILRNLLSLRNIPYVLFFNVGSLITRELVSNRFFNPVPRMTFRPEYDRVVNRRIRLIIRSIDDTVLQRQASIVVLSFNRLLNYLQFIRYSSESMEELKSSLLFFSLIHSECKYLMEYMEKNLSEEVRGSDHPRAKAFAGTCDSLSFQLQMELRKIHSGELMNLSKHKDINFVHTAVENSHGILTNFFQQSIIQLLSVFQPDLIGEQIFPEFISRKRQSIKLREDIAVLQALMDKFEEISETTEAGASTDTFVKYLILQKGWVMKMRRETAPLMRHQDLIEFDKYFKMVEELSLEDLSSPDKLDKFKMESKFFKIFVETTLGQIDNRADLQGVPLDLKRVENQLKRYISAHLK